MHRKKFIVGLTTLAVFLAGGLIACSDDDPTEPGDPGGLGNSDEGTVNALVYDLMLPLTQALNIGPFLDLLPKPGTANPSQCEPLDVCTSGFAMFCLGNPTLGDPTTITFTNCNSSGLLIDGIISFDGDASAGSGIISMTLGNYDLVGDITYSNVDGCFEQNFTNISLNSGNLEMTMFGLFVYCPPNIVGGVVIPNFASMTIMIPSLDRRVDVIISEDPPGDLQVILFTQGGSEPLLICDGNILGSSLTCFTGQE